MTVACDEWIRVLVSRTYWRRFRSLDKAAVSRVFLGAALRSLQNVLSAILTMLRASQQQEDA